MSGTGLLHGRLISAPCRLLARVRDVMAGANGGARSAEDRLDEIVRIIATYMVAGVCSAYVRRAERGYPTDWHLMNAGRFAVGGAGLVIVESTKIERRGCGTVGDLGLWHDYFVQYFKRLDDFIRQHGSVPGIQIGHSGRKAGCFRPWEGRGPLDEQSAGVDDWAEWELLVGPSTIADAGDRKPRALSANEIPEMVKNWGRAAARADAAGFDMLEMHSAHGYLLHQFLSPVAN